jgi:hypothetical protein
MTVAVPMTHQRPAHQTALVLRVPRMRGRGHYGPAVQGGACDGRSDDVAGLRGVG